MKNIIRWLREKRVFFAWPALVVGLLVITVACVRFGDYSMHMLKGDNEAAIDSVWFGDKSVPVYNMALAAYENNDYDSARKLMEKALSFCMGDDGQLMDTHRLIAANCHFYIGNCQFNMQKTSEAVAAYEECLKIHPPHLYAKYNLEKLQEKQPQSPQGGKGGKPAKKI